jgi:hypothetical protein
MGFAYCAQGPVEFNLQNQEKTSKLFNIPFMHRVLSSTPLHLKGSCCHNQRASKAGPAHSEVDTPVPAVRTYPITHFSTLEDRISHVWWHSPLPAQWKAGKTKILFVCTHTYIWACMYVLIIHRIH